MKRIAIALFVQALLCTGLLAQAVSEISGTVKDSSGAVVAEADVSVTQTDTGTYAFGTTSQNWSMRIMLTRSRCRNIHSLYNPEQVPETRLSWRRDIFQRLIEGISHPKWPNLGRRSARWHGELHSCLSYVLCEHCPGS